VLQAAGVIFLGEPLIAPGAWDEMALWMREKGIGEKGEGIGDKGKGIGEAGETVRQTGHPSWAYLRAARFQSRPGHADQLHLDLWWRGLNLAQDAGTYLYNAPPPWDNSLSKTCVHNTLTVDDQDQMRRSGRFLWLDWAQGEIVAREQAEDGSWERLAARHDGYRRLGWIHQRAVTAYREGRWVVEDSALSVGTSERPNVHTLKIHWLLPDWEWEISENRESRVEIRLRSPYGWIRMEIGLQPGPMSSHNERRTANEAPRITNLESRIPNLESRISKLQLVRGGELLYGSGEANPILGWVSPTYGLKVPALSLNVSAQASVPYSFISEWKLP
jgi:hypothetical protein